ncbi:hypothetical protein [Youhaiella tibetensis]|uniref:hypothetical protein n=1 Tax=Paradevosia tibetensis TaxID=1447062 RepID=UPI00147845E4|nr:hypothetical protein [Youhaiella tibetensis]
MMAKEVAPTPVDPKEAARLASRRKRSIALAVVLGVVVVLFYVLTIVKMGPAIFNRDL